VERRGLLDVCAVLLLPAVCACARSEAASVERRRASLDAQETFEERFLVRADGTALDRRTGLSWQRCPLGTVLDDGGTPRDLEDDRCVASSGAPQTLSWNQAVTAARRLDDGAGFAGHRDWRVPARNELLSIVEARWTEPRILGRVFPVTLPDPFLASTVYSAVETLSWEAHSRRGAAPAIRMRLVR
jgi:hypothetical protein